MTSNPPETQPAAGLCKRPGCGSPLPDQDRGRTRQFCSHDCATRYHNGLRIPAPAPAGQHRGPARRTRRPAAAGRGACPCGPRAGRLA